MHGGLAVERVLLLHVGRLPLDQADGRGAPVVEECAGGGARSLAAADDVQQGGLSGTARTLHSMHVTSVSNTRSTTQ